MKTAAISRACRWPRLDRRAGRSRYVTVHGRGRSLAVLARASVLASLVAWAQALDHSEWSCWKLARPSRRLPGPTQRTASATTTPRSDPTASRPGCDPAGTRSCPATATSHRWPAGLLAHLDGAAGRGHPSTAHRWLGSARWSSGQRPRSVLHQSMLGRARTRSRRRHRQCGTNSPSPRTPCCAALLDTHGPLTWTPGEPLSRTISAAEAEAGARTVLTVSRMMSATRNMVRRSACANAQVMWNVTERYMAHLLSFGLFGSAHSFSCDLSGSAHFRVAALFRVGGACGPPPPVAAPLVPRCALLPAATPRMGRCAAVLRTMRARGGPRRFARRV